MTIYTTGELAKLCGVSVRTVQYYDGVQLLKPHQLSENGRRLYSETEVQILRMILGYKQLGFALKDIQQIMASQQRRTLLTMLLKQQTQIIAEREQVLRRQKASVNFLLTDLTENGEISREINVIDIENAMAKKTQLQKLHGKMFAWGFLMDVIEIGLLVLGFTKGIWWPVWLGIPIVIGLGIYVSKLYYDGIEYVCPACQTQFKPRLRTMFFARHNTKARVLTCPHCQQKNYCLEVSSK